TPSSYTYPGDPVGNFDLSGTRCWFKCVVGKINKINKNVRHFQLNVAAVPIYAGYYSSNRALHAVNSLGNKHGTVGKIASRTIGAPLRPALWAMQAVGLGGDVALDWVKQKTVAPGEALADEGRRGGILPRQIAHGGPQVYLPGWRWNGGVDWEW
ncbi:MAG TPA: hypothetical protein VLH38_05660, partial [Patescibacteria group bacterium]|nr:hypothetical protein [Patescibacteria group bacterium]